MKLLRYEAPDGGAHDGLLHDNRVFPLLREGTTVDALTGLQEGNGLWRETLNQKSLELGSLKLLPPVAHPGAFLDFYTFEHHVAVCRKKRGLEIVPEWREHPVWYNGSTRCFSGEGSTVHFPPNEAKKDYELELAVVLSRPCRGVSVEAAGRAIGAYTIVNDFSAREVQEKVMRIGLGPAKAKDFSTGLGPWLVTPDAIGDPRNLRMRAWVNGELWSAGNSGDAHFTFAEMIAYAAEWQTLYPGDILASGTVGTGCGLEQDRFLKKGDKVELEIENIGRLTHWID